MALKDWKRSMIAGGIRYQKNSKKIILSKGFQGHSVDLPNRKSKYFKTKAQALKYARSYMRKH